MKFSTLVLTLLSIVNYFWPLASFAYAHINTENVFAEFVKKYGKQYEPGSMEHTKRLDVFKSNLELYQALNNKRQSNSTAWYGVNKFSDLTQEEFVSRYLSDINSMTPLSSSVKLKDPNVPSFMGYKSVSYPSKKDWRTSNVVSPVKNQKSCGACWAFSVVETVESKYAINNKELVSLSVQEVIDCSFGYDKILSGCKGGGTCQALEWLKLTKTPLVKESLYPLKDKMQPCKILNNSTAGVHVTDYQCKNFEGKETEMLQWIADFGPVSVSVDATNWNNYQGGIVQHHCGEKSNNHAVVVVGYDLTGEIPYYIAKNSWGPDFGNDGYIYLEVGENMCGVALGVAKADVQ